MAGQQAAPAAIWRAMLLPVLSLEGLWTAGRRPSPDQPALLSRSNARLCFVTRGQLLQGGLAAFELQLLLSGASPAPSILRGCLVRYKPQGRLHQLDLVSGTSAGSDGQLMLTLAASGRALPAASLSSSSPLEADAAWEQQGRAELAELAARLAPPTCQQLAATCCRLSSAWRWQQHPGLFAAAVQRDSASVAALLEHAPAVQQLLLCIEPDSSAAAAAGGGSKQGVRELSPAPPLPAERAGSGPAPDADSARAHKRQRSEPPGSRLNEEARRADRDVPPGTSPERLLLRGVGAACRERPSAWQPSFELGFVLRDLDRDWKRLVSGHSLVDLLAVLERRGHVSLQRAGIPSGSYTLCFRPSASFRAPPLPPAPPAQSMAPGQQPQPKSGGQAAATVLDATATERRREQHQQEQKQQQWEEAMPRGGRLEARLVQAVKASPQPSTGATVAQMLARISGRSWKDMRLPFTFGAALWELHRRGLALTEVRLMPNGFTDVFVSLPRTQ